MQNQENRPEIVRKSISFSAVVMKWAEELAAKKGFGSNFSAYVADLVRRDKERDEEYQVALSRQSEEASNSTNLAAAKERFVDVVQKSFSAKK